MSDIDNPDIWLTRARSSLARAQQGRLDEDILYEDLCFDCHQAAEKSIKAVLVFLKEDFPWTHSISKLFSLLESHLKISDEFRSADLLTRYATKTRYPGEYEPLTEDDYQEALLIAKRIYHWAEESIGLL
ncbi:MAG TPA: HEPN domain-containing protein [Leptospiraceae bacterium]|nr:HEPN domain-containing protein [Leptospiraceae bacterium]